ncbi:hypothetical protein pb186bvf_006715 [Paramecium bursaria]
MNNSQKFMENSSQINLYSQIIIMDIPLVQKKNPFQAIKLESKQLIYNYQVLEQYGGIDQIMKELNTDADNGLDLLQIQPHREKYGSNIMSNKQMKNFFRILCDYLSDILMEFLLILSIVHTLISLLNELDYVDGLTIIISILGLIITSAILEYQREIQFFQHFQIINDRFVYIVRSGNKLLYKASEIVVGDIIQIQSGSVVQADGVLLLGRDIRVDLIQQESSLANIQVYPYESNDQNKSIYLFAGSRIISGEGQMLVLSVGQNTEYYQMNNNTIIYEQNESKITQDLEQIATNLGKFGIITAILSFISLMTYLVISNKKDDGTAQFFTLAILLQIIQIMMICISIVILTIPDGLVYTVKPIILYMVNNLRKQNIWVKSVFISDKMARINELVLDLGALVQFKNNEYIRQHNLDKSLKQLDKCNIVCRIITDKTLNQFKSIQSQIQLNLYDDQLIDGSYFRENAGIQRDGEGYRIVEVEKFSNMVNKLKLLYNARVEDKLMLIDGLKQIGNEVGYASGLSEDILVLQKADFGFALESSDIAQDASNAIILNGGIHQIVKAFAWSWNIYDTVRIIIQYQITIIVLTQILIIIAVFQNIIEFYVVQILLITVFLDIFASLAYKNQKANQAYIPSPYIKQNEPLIKSHMYRSIIGSIIYGLAILVFISSAPPEWFQINQDQRNTFIFQTFMLFSIICLISSKNISFRRGQRFDPKKPINLQFWVILIIEILLLFIMVTFGGQFLKLEHLEIQQHLYSLGFGLVLLPYSYLFSLIPVRYFESKNDNQEKVFSNAEQSMCEITLSQN